MKSKSMIAMKGQEKYTSGLELQWIIGTSEDGPARIVDSQHNIVFASTYAKCLQYLAATGNRRA